MAENKVDSEMEKNSQSSLQRTDKVLLDSDSDLEKGETNRCCAPESRIGFIILKISSCILAGIVFGWALEKSRVFAPATIRGQMVFKRWIMLKMFLAAMGTGQLVLALMSVTPRVKNRLQESIASFAGCFSEKGLLSSLLGPFILGVGMTLSGACPGMVLAQVGSWTMNSIYTLVGALIGALVYGMIAPYVVKLTRPKTSFQIHTVHEKLKIPFIAVALPMSLMIILAVFLLEWFIPWEEDLSSEDKNSNNADNIFVLKSWPPAVGGVLIGVLQIVIVMAVGDTLGGSSSYQTVVSQWVIGKKLQKAFPYLAKFRCGIGNWWQVFFVMAAMLGGFLSALSSDSVATAKGVTIPTAICGGILLIVGARFAAGCTSGHGLSGAGLLFWLSLLAVPAMFAGGIATAYAMQATGALDHYVCYSGTPCGPTEM